MAETPYTGLTASVKLGGNPAGVNIGYISGCTLDLDKDIIEIIAFGMSFKEKIPAIKDWSMSVEGTAAFAATYSQAQLYDAYDLGTALVFGLYLNPTTYFEGTGYVQSMSIDTAPDDKINISAEIAGSGAIIFSMPSGTGMLTFVCADHATAGATSIASTTPAKDVANIYMYRVNAPLPAVGADLTGLPWTAYTLAAALPAINGDIITLCEVDDATAKIVVKRGQAVAVVT